MNKAYHLTKGIVLTALTWAWLFTGLDVLLALVITWFWAEYMHTYYHLANGGTPSHEAVKN